MLIKYTAKTKSFPKSYHEVQTNIITSAWMSVNLEDGRAKILTEVKDSPQA
jgi:hypothetical protein